MMSIENESTNQETFPLERFAKRFQTQPFIYCFSYINCSRWYRYFILSFKLEIVIV